MSNPPTPTPPHDDPDVYLSEAEAARMLGPLRSDPSGWPSRPRRPAGASVLPVVGNVHPLQEGRSRRLHGGPGPGSRRLTTAVVQRLSGDTLVTRTRNRPDPTNRPRPVLFRLRGLTVAPAAGLEPATR